MPKGPETKFPRGLSTNGELEVSAQGGFLPVGGSRAQRVDSCEATLRGELKSQRFVCPLLPVPHPTGHSRLAARQAQSPLLGGGNSSNQGAPVAIWAWHW